MAAERSPFIEVPPKTDVNPDVGLAVFLRLGMQTSALGGLNRPRRSAAHAVARLLGCRAASISTTFMIDSRENQCLSNQSTDWFMYGERLDVHQESRRSTDGRAKSSVR